MSQRPARLYDISPVVTPEDFNYIRLIGKGAHSIIKLARCNVNFRQYAIKECSKNRIARFHKVQNLVREKDILNSLDHPNIIRLENTYQDENYLYFCLEYHPIGDLAQLIRSKNGLSLDLTRFYAMEIINALEELQKNNVIHRDMKPENVLIDENFHIRLSDFGSAKFIDPAKIQRELESINFDGNDDELDLENDFSPSFDTESNTPELPKELMAQ